MRPRNNLSAAIIAIALLAACGGHQATPFSRALEAAREQNAAATRLLEAGNYERALQLYRAEHGGSVSAAKAAIDAFAAGQAG